MSEDFEGGCIVEKTEHLNDGTVIYSFNDPLTLMTALENPEIQGVVLATLLKQFSLGLKVRWLKDEPIEISCEPTCGK